MPTLTAPNTGQQQAQSGLDVGEQLENAATQGNTVITIGGSNGRANVPSTGSFAAKKNNLTRPHGSTGFACSASGD